MAPYNRRIFATFALAALLTGGWLVPRPSLAENGPQGPRWRGVITHTTDTGTDYGKEKCDAYHKSLGWEGGCGYNWIISVDGKIVEARGGNRVGAHTLGKNAEYLGVAFVGRSTINDAQLVAFTELLEELRGDYGTLEIRAHREFNKNKTCPGGEVWEKVRDL